MLFGLIQLVPYRVDNPPVSQEPAWTARGHVNSRWPHASTATATRPTRYWWEYIAPVSWWITNHVKDGRQALNFSECAPGRGENEASETVRNGPMPLNYYTWLGLHSNAKLPSR